MPQALLGRDHAAQEGRVQEASRIRNLQKHPLAKKFMASVRGADLAVFRDDQLQRVGPASVQRDLAILSHVFNVARRAANDA